MAIPNSVALLFTAQNHEAANELNHRVGDSLVVNPQNLQLMTSDN